MSIKQFGAVAAVLALASASFIMGASPASAATINDYTCTDGISIDVTVPLGGTLVVNSTDPNCTHLWLWNDAGLAETRGTVEYTLSDDSTGTATDPDVGAYDFSPLSVTQIRYTAPATGTQDGFTLDDYDSYKQLIISLVSAPAEVYTPPPPWVQAYGRFGADATCETGWDPSWQEWAQSVTGGWVCTKSVATYGRE